VNLFSKKNTSHSICDQKRRKRNIYVGPLWGVHGASFAGYMVQDITRHDTRYYKTGTRYYKTQDITRQVQDITRHVKILQDTWYKILQDMLSCTLSCNIQDITHIYARTHRYKTLQDMLQDWLSTRRPRMD